MLLIGQIKYQILLIVLHQITNEYTYLLALFNHHTLFASSATNISSIAMEFNRCIHCILPFLPVRTISASPAPPLSDSQLNIHSLPTPTFISAPPEHKKTSLSLPLCLPFSPSPRALWAGSTSFRAWPTVLVFTYKYRI